MKKAICTTLSVMFLTLIMGTVPTRSVYAATTWTVTSTADTSTAVPGNCPHATDCRLRDAIAAASAGDTITFDPSLSGQTIALSATLILDKDVTIDGSVLSTPIAISGDTDTNGTGNVRVFRVSPGVVAALNSLIITRGYSFGDGGGIYNSGTLTVMNNIFSNNSADSHGGGIFNLGTLTVVNSTFSENSSVWGGGGIFNCIGCTVTVTNSAFSGNTASNGEGGGISNFGGMLTITNSTFSDNIGGGIRNDSYNGTVSITDSSFYNNDYGLNNPATFTMTLTNTTFSGHTKSAIGNNGILTITNSNFSNNSAQYFGGAISNNGTLTITNSIFSGNSAATYDGGAIDNGGPLTIANSTFYNNFAANWGGAVSTSSMLTIMNSTFYDNSALYGGGIASAFGTMMITNSTFYNNSTFYDGGGIFNSNSSTLTITNSTFSHNSAVNGGGIFNDSSTLNYANTIISDSVSGGDCSYNPGFKFTIGTNIDNLVEDGSCSAAVSGDPHLGTLADHGGPTQTMALLAGSPAINAGDNSICAAAPVNNLDQRGITRPEGSACEIGAYEVDIPIVASIKRLDPDPTDAPTVDFQVTFSESVIGVDDTEPFRDFTLNATGVTGAFITAVSDSEETYTVTVDTGLGDGILRLEVEDDDSIVDASGNPLGGPDQGNGDYMDGEFYTINKTTPTLLSPVNTETLLYNRPAFDWSDTLGASAYQIVVSKNSSFSTPLLKEVSLTSTYTPASDLPAGKVLYWRVRAKAGTVWSTWSETWSFTTAQPPSIPILKSPANKALLKNYPPLLDWTNSAGANRYEVQIDTDKLFTEPILIKDDTITASYYTPGTNLDANSKYFWRVRSFNKSGEYSSWSTVWSFRTALSAPSNLTPADGEMVSRRKPALHWDIVDGASGYTIQISTSSSFATLLINTTITTNTFTPSTKLPANKVIYWRVRATGSNGPGRWTTASFHTP